MTSLYVPEVIPSNYKYITNINSTYYDLYDKPDISNSTGYFYRVYYGLSQDLFEIRTYNNSSYYNYTTIEINRTNDFLARHDIGSIAITTLSIVILIIFLVNIMTSLIKKGGLFSA